MDKPKIDIPEKTHPEWRTLLTVKDVARRLNVSISQVYALVDASLLRCYKITTKKQGGLRFSEQHLADYLASAEQGIGEEDKEEPAEPPQPSPGGKIDLW